MRQLEANPWDRVDEMYPVGTIVKGKVRNITDFGIFVGIEDGIDGLVHISDLTWGQRLRHPSDKYQKGDEVEARVFRRVCWHCHSDPDFARGDGGPGNHGGFGFDARGIDLSSYEGVLSGARDAEEGATRVAYRLA